MDALSIEGIQLRKACEKLGIGFEENLYSLAGIIYAAYFQN
jgi:hypothetical protein